MKAKTVKFGDRLDQNLISEYSRLKIEKEELILTQGYAKSKERIKQIHQRLEELSGQMNIMEKAHAERVYSIWSFNNSIRRV